MSIKDMLSDEVNKILSLSWDVRDGHVVPSTEIALAGGAVKLDATVLYADLAQSSYLATDFHQKTAAKVIRAFLYCMSRLITSHDGVITSFDGDRVMGIFLGDSKNTNAVTCALKMNYVVLKIIQPKIKDHFTSLRETGFEISHCVGVDTSSILAVRAGQRGSNDLVWIGRAPNLAAKLSEIRESPYHSFISEDVFSLLNKTAKYGDDPPRLMWEQRSYNFINTPTTIYRSNWRWEP
jgi:class 3 adenylate cyclase